MALKARTVSKAAAPRFERQPAQILKLFLIRLGAPKDGSPLFYRDVGLGAVFVLSMLIALLLVTDGNLTPVFWTCGALAALCFILATKRLALLAALFVFAAVRFGFVFLVSSRFSMLVAAVSCGLLAWVMAATDDTDYPDSDAQCVSR